MLDEDDIRMARISKQFGFLHEYNLPTIDFKEWGISATLSWHAGFIGLHFHLGPIDWYIGWWRR